MSNRGSVNKVCVVIPCYNTAYALDDILTQLKCEPVDVVVIDDGSTDTTSETAFKYKVKVIRNNRNLGKGASLRRGFDYALSQGYGTVIAMDGDGQHLPLDIVNFLKVESLSPEADIIVGNRMRHPTGMPRIRRLTNIIMSGLISWICGQSIPDTQNGFRLIRARLLGKLELTSNKFEIETEIILQAVVRGAKIINIPIVSVYKNHLSRIRPLLDTFRFVKCILPYIGFITKPPNPIRQACLSDGPGLRMSGNNCKRS